MVAMLRRKLKINKSNTLLLDAKCVYLPKIKFNRPNDNADSKFSFIKTNTPVFERKMINCHLSNNHLSLTRRNKGDEADPSSSAALAQGTTRKIRDALSVWEQQKITYPLFVNANLSIQPATLVGLASRFRQFEVKIFWENFHDMGTPLKIRVHDLHAGTEDDGVFNLLLFY